MLRHQPKSYQFKMARHSPLGSSHANSAPTPGLDGKLRVQHAGRDAELLQEELEAVAALDGADEDQRLSSHQAKLQQGVDQQELVLFFTLDAVLLQLCAVWQLRALKLQRHL